MSVQEAKLIYDSLKASGELKTLYTSMTGDWAKDSKLFFQQYKQDEDLIDHYMDKLDEDEDEDFGNI